MKKLLSAVLSFLLFFVFCGCGGEDDASNTSLNSNSQSAISNETSTEVNTSSKIIQN
ncbi:MAG: hypothetical protein U0L55_03655 [Acutalibacteraceae bacterium]|nr:hypothetical protein [Acutalibacteraceae bacterium]